MEEQRIWSQSDEWQSGRVADWQTGRLAVKEKVGKDMLLGT